LDLVTVPHVVAIDDAPDLLDVYRSILEVEGYRVSTLDDCSVEPAALLALEPDLLIVDLRCGTGLGGLDLLRRLRDDPEGGMIPAIVCTALSASALSAVASELLDLAVKLVVKPFDLDELLDCVRQVIVGTHDPRFGVAGRRERFESW
jgi:two-component system, OmpR family, response regulator